MPQTGTFCLLILPLGPYSSVCGVIGLVVYDGEFGALVLQETLGCV